MGSQQNIIVGYLRVVACKATNGKTVTFYPVGAGRPGFLYMTVDYLQRPWPRARPPCIKNLSAQRDIKFYVRRSTLGRFSAKVWPGAFTNGSGYRYAT